MSNTEADQVIASAQSPADTPREPGTYPMSRSVRTQAIILLLGVISIWVFALWTFIAIFPDGISGVEWVTGVLMLAIIVVAPVVAWTLLEEAYARITTDAQGITYTTLGGLSLKYPWDDIAGFKGKGSRSRIAGFFLGDDDNNGEDITGNNPTNIEEDARAVKAGEREESAPEEEPETVLLALRKDHAGWIANPVVRFLHRQAHGGTLPIYGGLENRKALLDEISSHIKHKPEP